MQRHELEDFPRTRIYDLDDQPELERLKGWYDSLRQGIEKPSDAGFTLEHSRLDEEPPKRQAS